MERVVGSDRLVGYCIIVVSAFFFYWISYATKRWLTPKNVKNPWKWKNILVSFMHAVVSGSWALSCFIITPKMAEDIPGTYNIYALCLVAMSIGYFFFDTCDMVYYCPGRQSYELLIHHITIIFCFTVSITIEHYIAYATMGLIQEVNSIFLHMRQLLQMYNVPRTSSVYRLNSLVNIGTFIVFRIAIMAWMTRWIMLNHHTVSFFLYSVGSSGLAIMTVINIVLLCRLLLSDFVYKQRVHSPKPDIQAE